jgi:hypothetical protein
MRFSLIRIHTLDIDWARALGVPLYIAEYKYPTKMLWFAAKALGHFLMMKLPAPNAGQWDFIFFKSIFRADYDRLFSDVAACAPGKVLIYEARYQPGFNLVGWKLLGQYWPLLISIFRQLQYRPWRSLYCFINYLRCMQAIATLSPLSAKVFVSFGDMQPLDNALIQYMHRHRGSQTVTLQHGLYLDTSGDPTQINTLNFRNVVAKYFLAWGKVTSDLVKRFSQTSPLVVGKPTLPIQYSEICLPSSKRFLVILDSTAHHSHNQRLLEIAKQIQDRMGLEFRVRPHPDNPPGTILQSLLHQPSDRYRFVVGHSTTLLIELAAAGVPVYRLNSDIPFHPGIEPLEISTVDDLMAILSGNADFRQLVSHLIQFTGAEAKGKYRAAFEMLLTNSGS